jgi:hypothetical protein
MGNVHGEGFSWSFGKSQKGHFEVFCEVIPREKMKKLHRVFDAFVVRVWHASQDALWVHPTLGDTC